RQEELKKKFPPEARQHYKIVDVPRAEACDADMEKLASRQEPIRVKLVESVHPDLGRLGVFWHTQGSGKSYSMAFFAEKVRRRISARFTFLLMTDRNDLDDQIYGTFVGCGVADENTPRAGSGDELKRILQENHRYV